MTRMCLRLQSFETNGINHHYHEKVDEEKAVELLSKQSQMSRCVGGSILPLRSIRLGGCGYGGAFAMWPHGQDPQGASSWESEL